MTDTDTMNKPKAPPAWMQRDPMTRHETANRLAMLARGAAEAADVTADRDVADGLRERSRTIAEAAVAITDRRSWPLTVERMQRYADARLACARTTTEAAIRAGYMDDAHTFREAVRHLKGGE